jgi:hypothetical protein
MPYIEPSQNMSALVSVRLDKIATVIAIVLTVLNTVLKQSQVNDEQIDYWNNKVND